MAESYNILDRTYFNVLNMVCAKLQRQRIEYAVVGGAAAQILIADAVGWRSSSLEGRLRKTRDIDLSLKVDSNFNPLSFFNSLDAEENRPGYASINGVKINYTTEPKQFKGLESFFNSFIEGAIEVQHPTSKDVVFRTEKPEDLIITKLTRKGKAKAKDSFDIISLLKAYDAANKKIDDEGIKSMLKQLGREGVFPEYLEMKYSV